MTELGGVGSLHPRSLEAVPSCCPIVELRQYTLRSGMRDVLVELFDPEFVETRELVGMKVIGQFRDLDDPDRFVFVRGFDDMAERARSLQAFYGGNVWRKHREAANAGMLGSSNVLLLRPARPASGFSLGSDDRPLRGATGVGKGLVTASTYSLDPGAGDGFAERFECEIRAALQETGAVVLASFVTESSANNFPALRIREGENAFVCFLLFADLATYVTHTTALSQLDRRRAPDPKARMRGLPAPSELRRLLPTVRSHRHG